MEQYNIRTLSERAMRYGTLLGLATIFTNLFYLLGLKLPFFSTLFLLFLIAIPFFAGRITIIYRKRERENHLRFSEAWLFLLIMFLCAAILSAIAQLIYFQFFDKGFFIEFLLEQFNTLTEMETVDAALQEQLTSTAELLKALKPRDIVMQIFVTNITFAPIITFIIALFVKKK